MTERQTDSARKTTEASTIINSNWNYWKTNLLKLSISNLKNICTSKKNRRWFKTQNRIGKYERKITNSRLLFFLSFKFIVVFNLVAFFMRSSAKYYNIFYWNFFFLNDNINVAYRVSMCFSCCCCCCFRLCACAVLKKNLRKEKERKICNENQNHFNGMLRDLCVHTIMNSGWFMKTAEKIRKKKTNGPAP